MTKCDTCGKKDELPKGYNRNFCDDCIKDKEIGFSHVIDTVYLRNYGNESVKRIGELERRVILPYELPDGRYLVGRLNEKGKIDEREPSY